MNVGHSEFRSAYLCWWRSSLPAYPTSAQQSLYPNPTERSAIPRRGKIHQDKKKGVASPLSGPESLSNLTGCWASVSTIRLLVGILRNSLGGRRSPAESVGEKAWCVGQVRRCLDDPTSELPALWETPLPETRRARNRCISGGASTGEQRRTIYGAEQREIELGPFYRSSASNRMRWRPSPRQLWCLSPFRGDYLLCPWNQVPVWPKPSRPPPARALRSSLYPAATSPNQACQGRPPFPALLPSTGPRRYVGLLEAPSSG